MKSNRLPGKALACVAGRALLEWLFLNLVSLWPRDRLVICTTTLPEDHAIISLAERHGIHHFYRGAADDVLGRMLAAAEACDLAHFAVATGDNPFLHAATLHEQLRMVEDDQADYAVSTGLPLGCAGQALSTRAVREVCQRRRLRVSEIWPPYFEESGLFRKLRLAVPPSLQAPDLRLTVDYAEDLDAAGVILNHIPDPTRLADIIAYARSLPHLQEMRRHLHQNEPSPDALIDARALATNGGVVE